MEILYFSRFQSAIGPLTVVVSERGLMTLEFGGELPRKRKDVQWIESEEKTRPCVQQVIEYLAGERKQFDLPLDLRGTEFQKRCWHELLSIPYGATRTYAEIARAVGCPRGFRAVGMANHDNPVAIIVPCHRVIASDGRLGGYGGGLDLKRRLLDLEAAGKVGVNQQ